MQRFYLVALYHVFVCEPVEIIYNKSDRGTLTITAPFNVGNLSNVSYIL